MMLNRWLALGLPFFLVGCDISKEDKQSQSIQPPKQIVVDSSTTIELQTQSELNSIFSYLSIGEVDYFAVETGDSISVFSMKTGSSIYSVSVPPIILKDTSGEYALKSICLNDSNDIFMITRKLIVRVNNGAVSQKEINIRSDEYLLYNLQNDHPVFDKVTGKLYLQKYSTKYSQTDSGFYKTPVLSAWNWETGLETDAPINYPEIYFTNNYGFGNQVYYSSNLRNTVLSFTSSPDFFVYNRITGVYRTINGRSENQAEEITPLPKTAMGSRREKMQHWYTIPEYHETLIDAADTYIYRFFLNGQTLKRKDGGYNGYWDKQFFLMLFDNNGTLLKEFDLSNRRYDLFFSFPGYNKLYMRQDSENGKPVFRVFKFRKD